MECILVRKEEKLPLSVHDISSVENPLKWIFTRTNKQD